MAGQRMNQARIAQTREAFRTLLGELDAWIDKRTAKDSLRQYETQLKTLSGVLHNALDRLHAKLDGLRDNDSTREIYRACRAFDEYLVWVRRLWEYYREKFDQRDEPRLIQVLAAADEVVWSLYAEVFRNLPAAIAAAHRGPVPLPYIGSLYSPMAFTRDRVDSRLQAAQVGPDFLTSLQAYISQLPIAVVSLPPLCVHAPWWLVYLGHEVGHHIQHDLQLVGSFERWLKATVVQGAEPDIAVSLEARWKDWREELFADVFSVYMMGPQAVWAIAELELTSEQAMLTNKGKAAYPPPLVRLAFLAHLAGALCKDRQGRDILRAFDVDPTKLADDAPTEIAADLTAIRSLVSQLPKAKFDGMGSFAAVCDWKADLFKPSGEVDRWAKSLRRDVPPQPELTLQSARLAASGAMLAWSQIANSKPPQKTKAGMNAEPSDKEHQNLVNNILLTIPKNREEGTRATAETPQQNVEALGAEFADLLLAADVLPGE